MSPVPRSRFVPPASAPRKRTRSVEVRPLGGLHTGVPPQDLRPGYSPALKNFVPDPDGLITPRSGLSAFGTHDFGGPVLGASEVFDDQGASCAFAPSTRSLSFFHPTNGVWSELSYVPGSLSWMQGLPSGLSTDLWDSTSIFDIATNSYIAVASNNVDSLKFFTVDDATTTYSDFTYADSIDSTSAARGVASVNDRLVLFNTLSSTNTKYPTRVMWSARGNPKSFLIDDGAGAEDLMDMKGEGIAAVRFKDFLLLFTNQEIWRATPTLDSYAFRFDRVVDNQGTRFAKTIVATPNGVIFLGRDYEVYVTDGAGVYPLGPEGGEGLSRIQRYIKDNIDDPMRAWALYNQSDKRYELFFPTTASTSGFPDRALFFDLVNRTWWPQEFGAELSSGVDVEDASEGDVIDAVEDAIDDVPTQFDLFAVVTGDRRPNVFTATGSALRFRSDQTSDAGTAIDARWRSGGLGGGAFRQTHLTEVWTDYETDETSSASLFVGNARDADAFSSGVTLSFTTPGGVVFTPTWKTSRDPNFEIRIADGSRPKIASFSATLKDGSKF